MTFDEFLDACRTLEAEEDKCTSCISVRRREQMLGPRGSGRCVRHQLAALILFDEYPPYKEEAS